jgi:YbbR-like protein
MESEIWNLKFEVMFLIPSEKTINQRKEFFLALVERIFLRDWGTKLMALAITLAIWFGVTGQSVTRRIRNVHVNYLQSNEMQITNDPIHEVEITITGDKQKIDQLKEVDLVISADLSDIQPGDKIVQLSPETVSLDLPSGVKLDEVQPNKIAVKLEKVLEREIDVKADFEDSLPEGLEVYSKIAEPAKVRVRGPESVVKSLDSISTEKISLENRNSNFVAKQIGLNLVNSKVTVLDSIVDVSVKLGEKRTERLITVETKHENELKTFNVVLLAPRSVLDKIKSEDIQITLGTSPDGKLIPTAVLPAELQNLVEIKSIK